LGSVLDSFGDMAVHTQTDRQTDGQCHLLSPLALRAGGEKISFQFNEDDPKHQLEIVFLKSGNWISEN